MNDKHKKLSNYIDDLNAEQKPIAHENLTDDKELSELYHTVRKIRTLKEPTMPRTDFQKTLVNNIKHNKHRNKALYRKKRVWVTSVVSITALLFLAIALNFILPFSNNSNIVHAMEEAFQEVKAYHGNLTIVETNANGDMTTQATLNVWANKKGHYYTSGVKGTLKGLVTVNNGDMKWQIVPEQKQVRLFETFPDTYRFTFEIGNEIEEVKNALSTKVVGEESVGGRNATIIEVVPKGGEPYRIWIDRATNLPIQKETTMYNALQYKITFTELEVTEEIPDELLAYNVPGDYEEIESNADQILNNWTEAMEYVDFAPRLPSKIPSGFTLEKITILPDREALKLYYMNPSQDKTVTVVQGNATDEFILDSHAILGKIDNQPAEILSPINESNGILGSFGPYASTTDIHSIRWQKGEMEYTIVGNTPMDVVVDFTKSMTDGEVNIQPNEDSKKGQIEVPVDIEVEENDQKSADAGHLVFKLDPVFASQVFVSLKISPEGIKGEYPIKLNDLRVIENTGIDAIVDVTLEKTPIKRVYLKRLIRKDSTGIWTVVGYDLTHQE